MKFGEWKITPATIEWSGTGPNRFVIERSSLLETMYLEEAGDNLYKWIVLASQEEWLGEDDLYDLNFAFVFAAAQFGEGFDYNIFDNTLEYQFNLFEEEDEDEAEPL